MSSNSAERKAAWPLGEALGEPLWRAVNLVQSGAILLWTAFWIVVALVVALALWSRDASLFLARRVWAPGILAICGVRLSVAGRERLPQGSGYLVVANHSAHLDIPILFAALPLPVHFVAKRELALVPFLGWYIRLMGMVFIDRSDRSAAVASIGQATSILARGRVVITFPEGTRSRDGRLQPFKRGGFSAALEARVPVVPVAIVGVPRVMAPRGMHFRPGRVTVTIGDPIPTADLPTEARAELATQAEAAMRRLLASSETG